MMILGCQGDYIIFKTESDYFNNIQLNVHNRDSFFILFFIGMQQLLQNLKIYNICYKYSVMVHEIAPVWCICPVWCSMVHLPRFTCIFLFFTFATALWSYTFDCTFVQVQWISTFIISIVKKNCANNWKRFTLNLIYCVYGNTKTFSVYLTHVDTYWKMQHSRITGQVIYNKIQSATIYVNC